MISSKKMLDIILCLWPWLTQAILVKFNFQGQFWNPQDEEIPKLSLVLMIDQNLMELLNKTKYQFLPGVKEQLKAKYPTLSASTVYSLQRFFWSTKLIEVSYLKLWRPHSCYQFDIQENNIEFHLLSFFRIFHDWSHIQNRQFHYQ